MTDKTPAPQVQSAPKAQANEMEETVSHDTGPADAGTSLQKPVDT